VGQYRLTLVVNGYSFPTQTFELKK